VGEWDDRAVLRPTRDLVGKVEEIVKEVSDEVIRPRFRALSRSDVSVKAPAVDNATWAAVSTGLLT